jgi:HEAT repeat protein
MQLEDDEWLVRNAAAEALAETHRWDDLTALPYELVLPQPESEPWLIAWTAERGEGTGVGDAALATLIRALNEGDSPTREMALDTLRRLADPRSIDVLRRTLRDPDPIVRDTALIALDEISRRHDITITMN